MEKNARIYIAGHRGLVGSAIVRRLERAGYENLILRTRSELNLLDKAAVDGFFAAERPEYVFLAAAKVGGIHANDSRPADFIYDNLSIQNNVIHAAWRNRVKKLIFLGSSCIYPRLAPQPMREDYLLSGPLEPTNSAYALAKIAGIEMCHAFNRQYGTDFIPVMPTNLYGPNDNYDLMDSHVLPALIRKFHLAKLAAAGDDRGIAGDAETYGVIPNDFYANLAAIATFSGHRLSGWGAAGISAAKLSSVRPAPEVMLWGSGRPKREFLYADDLADALLFIALNYRSTELLNIGSGVDQTIKELAETVREIVGFNGGLAFDPQKPDGMPRKLLDVGRLKALGWQARICLADGVKLAYQDYLAKIN